MNANDQKYLKAYPDCDSFFFSSDGLAFFDKGEAQKHQDNLKGNHKVRELHRSEKKPNNTK